MNIKIKKTEKGKIEETACEEAIDYQNRITTGK